MRAVGPIIAGTPTWVWALLVLLVYLGTRALRSQTAPLWRIAILPTVFVVWGLYGLIASNNVSLQRTAPWLLALAVGTAIGFTIAGLRPIRADRTHGLVHVAGGPFTLVLSLLIFAIKYVFGVLHAMDPTAFADARFWLTELAVSGVLTGMFIGRFAGLWRQYRAAPEEDLSGGIGAGRQPA
jgi:hypothetical protein